MAVFSEENIKKNVITGTADADSIDASNYVNKKKKGITIKGLGGGDTITGTNYADTIYAMNGDIINFKGNFGKDTIVLSPKADDEAITIDFGNVNFALNDVDGYMNTHNDSDVFVFATCDKNGKDLKLYVNDASFMPEAYSLDNEEVVVTRGVITIKDYAKKDLGKVYIQYGENKVLLESLLTGAINDDETNGVGVNTTGKKGTIRGTRFNDEIMGSNGKDTIYTGTGNDYIYSEMGKDKIIIDGAGDKYLMLGQYGANNTVSFAKGVTGANLYLDNWDSKAEYSRKGNDLVATYKYETGKNEVTTLKDYFVKDYDVYDEYNEEADNYNEINLNGLTFNTGSMKSVQGSKFDETFYVGKKTKEVNSGAGDDIIVSAYQSLKVNGGAGDNTLTIKSSKNDFTYAIGIKAEKDTENSTKTKTYWNIDRSSENLQLGYMKLVGGTSLGLDQKIDVNNIDDYKLQGSLAKTVYLTEGTIALSNKLSLKSSKGAIKFTYDATKGQYVSKSGDVLASRNYSGYTLFAKQGTKDFSTAATEVYSYRGGEVFLTEAEIDMFKTRYSIFSEYSRISQVTGTKKDDVYNLDGFDFAKDVLFVSDSKGYDVLNFNDNSVDDMVVLFDVNTKSKTITAGTALGVVAKGANSISSTGVKFNSGLGGAVEEIKALGLVEGSETPTLVNIYGGDANLDQIAENVASWLNASGTGCATARQFFLMNQNDTTNVANLIAVYGGADVTEYAYGTTHEA